MILGKLEKLNMHPIYRISCIKRHTARHMGRHIARYFDEASTMIPYCIVENTKQLIDKYYSFEQLPRI